MKNKKNKEEYPLSNAILLFFSRRDHGIYSCDLRKKDLEPVFTPFTREFEAVALGMVCSEIKSGVRELPGWQERFAEIVKAFDKRGEK